MPQQQSSPLLLIAGTAVITLILGGIVGYYLGYDRGWEGSVETAKRAQNTSAEVQTNPLQDVKTNPYSDVRLNPFE